MAAFRKQAPSTTSEFRLEELEPRVLFSADLPAAALGYVPTSLIVESNKHGDQSHNLSAAETINQESAQFAVRDLVIIDAAAGNIDAMLADLESSISSKPHVVVMGGGAGDPGRALSQLSEIIGQHTQLQAVHLVSHGAAGELTLAGEKIDAMDLLEHSTMIEQWRDAFADGGDLLIYGCDVAAGSQGEAFVEALSLLSGADVAASTDLTGGQRAGGNWSFEAQTGNIERSVVFSDQFQQDYTQSFATYTVSTLADSGAGSLREAITLANASMGTSDVIEFSVAGTIALSTVLPSITDTLTIDGTTAPGYVDSPVLFLDGDLLGSREHGLVFNGSSDGSLVRGLAITNFNGFNSAGIVLQNAGSHTIEANYLGTDGSDAAANWHGLQILGSSGNTIGGITAAQGNVISGNFGNGIEINGASSSSNTIQNNLIGTDADGTGKVGNVTGIYLYDGALNNEIGGKGANAGNVISGNDEGLVISAAGHGNVIAGNIIGLASDGNTILSNIDFGILLGNTDQTLIGADGGDYTGNVISGNEGNGLQFLAFASNNTITGNLIGTDASGTLSRGNGSNGIALTGAEGINTIGGTTAAEQNTIANNGANGILVTGNFSAFFNILGNSIYDNDGLGVDLNDDGVTVNDSNDSDAGPNTLQNWAVLNSVSIADDGTFNYALDTTSLSAGTYRVDFYASTEQDSSRIEGERYLGSVSGIVNGNSTLSGTLSGISMSPGEFVTLITSDASGNSSEFSPGTYASDGDSDGLSPEAINLVATSNGGLDINTDGGNDLYLVAEDGEALLSGASELSFETRFSTTESTGAIPLLSYVTSSASDDKVTMLIQADGNALIEIDGDSYLSSAIDYNTLRDGQGHTVGLTWDGTNGNWSIYVDGVETDGTAISGGQLLADGEMIGAGGALIFGQSKDSIDGSFDSNEVFKGTLFFTRLFSDSRSAIEMASSYRSVLSYDESDMLAQWNFNRLSIDGTYADSVAGQFLSIMHVDDAGFFRGEASLTLAVNENALDGTELGRVGAIDPQREAEKSALLAADPELRYSALTDKFYKVVPGSYLWGDAMTSAQSTTLNSVAGQLVTISSALENAFVHSLGQEMAGASYWLGATDFNVEGEWRWVDDGRESDLFWSGDEAGYAHTGAYSNFDAGQPNDLNNSEDVLRVDIDSGKWIDADKDIHENAYVIEWHANEVLNATQAIAYSISTQTASGAFEVDADTGVINLRDGRLLDTDLQSVHNVTIYAEDVNGNGNSRTLSIIVNPQVEDGPAVSDLSSGIEINTDEGNDTYLIAQDGGAILGDASQLTIEILFATQDISQANLISYMGSDAHDDLLVSLETDGTLSLSVNNMTVSGLSGIDYNLLRDGNPHAIALNWDNTHGNWSVYVDGNLTDSGTGLAAGDTLGGSTGIGELLFGQEQDTLAGGFDSSEIFAGTYYDVRIWDKVRTSGEIALNHHSKLDITAAEATEIGLLANWQMKGFDSSGDVVDIVSGNNLRVGEAGVGGMWVSSSARGDLQISEHAIVGTDVGFVLPGGADSGRDVVTDGLFYEAMDPGVSQDYNNGDTLGAWTVSDSGAGVSHLGSMVENTPLGGSSVYLNRGAAGGGFNQLLDVEAGREYQVVFAISGWHDTDELYKQVRVSAGGVSQDFGHEHTADWSAHNLLWEQRSFTFVADSSEQTLSFESLNLSGDGAIIADVRVVEIPQAIASVLDNDSTLDYDAATGKFYRFVDSADSFSSQLAAATGSVLNGVNGQLVRIDSHYEHEFVRQYAIDSGHDIWLGATDENNDGNWNWLDGTSESLEQFWTGGSAGSAAAGYYVPTFLQSEASGENFVRLTVGGIWADDTEGSNNAYVIQWNAAEVISSYSYELTEQDGTDSPLFVVDSDGGIRLANPTAPDVYAQHIVQLDASDSASITQSGGLVSAIADTSGNANGASQGSSGSQPTLAAGALNGFDALQFDGVDDSFVISSNALLNSDTDGYEEKSITIAFQTSDDVTSRQFLFEQGGQNNGLSLYIQDGRLFGGAYSGTIGFEGNWVSTAIDPYTTYSATYAFNSVAGDMRLFVNGEYVDNNEMTVKLNRHVDGIGLGANQSTSKTHEGSVVSSSSGNHFKGLIGEFSHHNESLASEEIIDLHAYMMNKWLGTTTTPDYTEQSSYHNQILIADAEGNSYRNTVTIAFDNYVEANQSVPLALTIDEDTALTFTGGTVSQISVSDSNSSEDSLLRVTLSVNDGVLNLFQTTNLTFAQGDGSDFLVIDGTESAINAALDGMVFMPDANFNGIVTLDMTTAIAADLEGHYTFESDTFSFPTVEDQSAGTLHDGTVTGASVVNDPERGEVLLFGGAGDSVEVTGLYGEPEDVTLAAWIKTSGGGDRDIISLGDNVGLRVNADGTLRAFYSDAISWVEFDTDNSIEDDWIHVAATFDNINNAVSIYLNGERVLSEISASSLNYTYGNNTFIGSHGNGDSHYDFVGLIDDARIYSRALSAQEIQAIASDPLTATDTLAISVTAINDAPRIDAENLIVNGDLETGDLSGWTTSGTVSNTGGNHLRFGEGDAAGPHTASQSITTVIGETYTLNFSYRDDGGPLTQQMHVSVDGVTNNVSDVLTSSPFGSFNVDYTYSFVADSTTSTLSFTDVTPVDNGSGGAIPPSVDGYIDNVSVIQQASFTSVSEDDTDNDGNTVASLLGSVPGDLIIDSDAGAIEGIAIIAASSTFEYSTDDGTVWQTVGTVSDSSALLLRSNDLVRFIPNELTAQNETIEFRAWDQTSGMQGIYVNTSSNGGSSAFSMSIDTATIITSAINDAPTLDRDPDAGTGHGEPLDNPSFVQGGPSVLLEGNIQIFDPELTDGDDFSGATLALQRNGIANSDDVFSTTGNLVMNAGTLELGSIDIGTYTNAFGQLSLRFANGVTNEQVNEAMQSIAYSNISAVPPATVDIQWTANDGNTAAVQGSGGALTATHSTSVTIQQSAVAGHSVPGAQLVNEDQILTFSSLNGNAVAVTDSLAGSDGQMQVSLSVNDGVLILSQTDGIRFVSGVHGSNQFAFNGTESAINAALEGMTFHPDAEYSGSVTMSMTTALAADLLGHYTFESANPARDVSAGFLQSGTFNADAITVNDNERGDVLSLDGTGDFMRVSSLYDEPADVTLAAWTNLAGVDTNGAVVISMGSSPALYFNAAGELVGSYASGGADYIATFSDNQIGNGWNHVAMSIDSAKQELSLFVNGLIVETISATNPIEYDNGTRTYVGRDGTGATGSDFNGRIDDVRIYSRALSGEEVAALYLDNASTTDSVAITVNNKNDAPAFGVGPGVSNENIPDATLFEYADDVIALSDGTSITAGNAVVNGLRAWSIVKWTADGSLDTSFATDGVYINEFGAGNDYAGSIVEQTDGKLLISGFSSDGVRDYAVLRLNADGSVDEEFGSNGVVTIDLTSSDSGNAIAIQSNGDILVTGSTKADTDIRVFRLHGSDGELDNTFGTNGIATIDLGASEYATSMAVDSSGRILISGGRDSAAFVARLTSTGSLDTSFNGIGYNTTLFNGTNSFAQKIIVQNDGSYVIVGSSSHFFLGFEQIEAMGIARFNASGALDSSFGDNGAVRYLHGGNNGYSLAADVTQQTDGKLVVVGTVMPASMGESAVLRYNVDGTLDSSFGENGVVTAPAGFDWSEAFGVDIAIDGTILVAGYAAYGGLLDYDTTVWRYDSTGTLIVGEGSGGINDSPTFVEGGAAVVLDTDVFVFDRELSAGENFNGSTLTLTRSGGASSDDAFSASGLLEPLMENSDLVYDGVSMGHVTTNSSGSLELLFNASATNVLVNNALRSIAYSNTSDTPPLSVQIDWTFDDGGDSVQTQGGSAEQASGSTTVMIQIAPAISIVSPATVTTNEDTAYVFSGSNAISVADTQAADSYLQIGLSVSNGVLNLANQSGITFIEGANGSASLVIEGLASDLNTALDGLIFTPDADYNGGDMLSITTGRLTDLAGQYTFDSTTVSLSAVEDQSAGTSHHGTITGASLTVDPERGDVLSFDGSGDSVEIAGIYGEPTDATLAAWIKTSGGGNREVISLGDNVALRVGEDGTLSAFYFDSDTWQFLDSSVNVENEWVHVAATFDETDNSLSIYINGELAISETFSTWIAFENGTNSFIGVHGNGSEFFDFDGLIDDARIYTRALSAEEISALVADQAYTSDTVAITVNAVNDAPIITSDSVTSLVENQESVLMVTSSDVDGGTPVYSIAGGADQALFTIDETFGTLTFRSPPDFESAADVGSDNVYNVIVQADDGRGGTSFQLMAISVTNVNESPVITSAPIVDVAENQNSVLRVNSSDEDGDELRYSITGGVDAASFSIDEVNGSLTFNSVPDFETQSDYEVAVSVTDVHDNSHMQLVTVHIVDINEAPDMDNISFDISSEFRGEIGQLVATDPDSGDELVFQLIADGSNLTTENISLSDQGVLSTQAIEPGTYQFSIRVVDTAGLAATAQLTLRVELSEPVEAGAANPEQTDIVENITDSSPGETKEQEKAEEPEHTEELAKTDTFVTDPLVTDLETSMSEQSDTDRDIQEKISTNRNFEDISVYVSDVIDSINDTDSEDGIEQQHTVSLESSIILQMLIDQFSNDDSTLVNSLSSLFGTSTSPLTFSINLVDQLELSRSDFESREAERLLKQTITTTAGAAITATLSVGFATWMFQSGMLVASAMTTAPLWRSIDPIPILAAGTSANDDESDKASLKRRNANRRKLVRRRAGGQ